MYYNICCILSVPKKVRNVTIHPAHSVALAGKVPCLNWAVIDVNFLVISNRHNF